MLLLFNKITILHENKYAREKFFVFLLNKINPKLIVVSAHGANSAIMNY